MSGLLNGILSDVGLGNLVSTDAPGPPQGHPTHPPTPNGPQGGPPQPPGHETSSSSQVVVPTTSNTPTPTSTPTPSSTSTPAPATTSPQSTTSTTSSSTSTSQSTSATTGSHASSTQISSASAQLPTTTTTSTSTPDSGGNNNTGAIAAGIIACIAIVGIMIATIVWIYRRKAKAKHVPQEDMKGFGQLDDRDSGDAALLKEIGGGAAASSGWIARKPVGKADVVRPKSRYSPDSLARTGAETVELKPIVYEMPDTSVPAEMDGGQKYHAYRPS